MTATMCRRMRQRDSRLRISRLLRAPTACATPVSYTHLFGVLEIENDNRISGFREKNDSDGSMINVGFMVCEPQVFDYIEGDSTVLEKAPLENLAKDGQLVAYRHEGFWQCMDTQREKQKLEELWASGRAPWKVWEE